MAEWVLLAVALTVAGAIALWPLRRPRGESLADDPGDRDAAAVRYRVALETLRDVEADRQAGSLDDAAYERQLAEAEARAAAARADLEAPQATLTRRTATSRAALPALAAGGVIAVILLVGAAIPATGVANRTVVDEGLAQAQATEAARQARITELLADLAADPMNPRTLSDLADAHLAGATQDDLVRAAVALRVLIELEPERADAYERIIAAYLRAGDYANARAAHDAYAAISTADPVEVAFLDGIIALRGENDPQRAVAAFDRFLELAPDDPRARMIRGLREEAAGT